MRRALRVLLTTMSIMVFLSACQQDTSVQTFDQGPSAEPPEVSFKEFGKYVLHFNGISTDLLEPGIAQKYGIIRSKSRALLTVSIIRMDQDESVVGVSVPAEVNATANNLTGQLKNLTLRKIQEGESYYYIGDVAVANAETLVFNVSATPMNETDSLSVRFMRQFFTD